MADISVTVEICGIFHGSKQPTTGRNSLGSPTLRALIARRLLPIYSLRIIAGLCFQLGTLFA